MAENNKMYPMRLCDLEDSYIWGKDIFNLADLGYRDTLIHDGWLAANTISEVMDTYMDKIVGDTVFSVYGRQFPIQMKRIVCNGKMPLRVHPDDETADSRYDALGREKLWYVAKASQDASLILGFAHDMDAQQLLAHVENGTIEEDLNYVKPKAGTAYRIKPGIVHGAAGEIEIIEVSQASALDFCVFPWGQELGAEEFDSGLTLIDALDFIEYRAIGAELCDRKKVGKGVYELLNLPQFIVNKIELDDALRISSEKTDTFALYQCLYGKVRIKASIDGEESEIVMEPGHTVLMPAEVSEYILEPAEHPTALIEALGQTVIQEEFPPLEDNDNEQ